MGSSMPIMFMFVEYPVHQGKLNLLQMIYMSSRSRASVFNMVWGHNGRA